MRAADFLLVGLLGGFLGIDRTAFMQSLVSRPIVAAPLAGLIAQDVETGLACGVLLEFLWLMRLPVGGSIPPDDSLSALCACLFAAALKSSGVAKGLESAALGALFSLPFGYLGRSADIAVRRFNGEICARARRKLSSGELVAIGPYHLAGLAMFFATGFVMAALTGAVSYYAAIVFGKISTGSGSPLFGAMLYSAVALSGAGSLLVGLNVRRGFAYYAIAAFATAAILWGVG